MSTQVPTLAPAGYNSFAEFLNTEMSSSDFVNGIRSVINDSSMYREQAVAQLRDTIVNMTKGDK